MRTILISGAASGLGAAFLEAYRHDEATTIIAVDRTPTPRIHANVVPYVVDIASESSVHGLANALGTETALDLVIHSAGIRGLVPHVEDGNPGDVAACETLHAMDLATLRRAFEVNAAGTFLLLRALVPRLRQARDPKVIVMSSRMGSVGSNEHPNRDAGGGYAYRASKAALNMIVRSLAADVPAVTFVLCHPGRVETSLVHCREEGAIGADESVAGLLPLIERWGREQSGKYFDRFGEPIPW